MPFLPERIEGWWGRDAEIDVLAIRYTERVALVGKCKWSIHLVGTNVLEALKHKAGVLLREIDLCEDRIRYALFTRSGFTPAMVEKAVQEGIGFYTVEHILQP